MLTDTEIDHILATKIIYLCEKISDSESNGVIFTSAKYASLIGMSEQQVARIIDIFQFKKIAEWESVIQQGEDDEGRYEEFEYDNVNFNRKGLKNLAKKLKLKHHLRDEPLIRREELLRIEKQIKSVFSQDQCTQILSKFYTLEDVHMYFTSRKYSPADLLFYLSYSKSDDTKITEVLAEFLNPVYYDLNQDTKTQDLFSFLDKVLAVYLSDGEYKDWEKCSSRYVDLTNKKRGKINYYITKVGDDFFYKGSPINLFKNNDYYKVFCSLYDLIPNGGEVPYEKLGKQIKSKNKKSKEWGMDKMIKFIQTNLTDRSNGFMHYAKIPDYESNGKPLLSVNRGQSIIFNNKAG